MLVADLELDWESDLESGSGSDSESGSKWASYLPGGYDIGTWSVFEIAGSPGEPSGSAGLLGPPRLREECRRPSPDGAAESNGDACDC